MIEKVLRAWRNHKMKMPSDKTNLKQDFETGHFHETNKILLAHESNFFRSTLQDVFRI